MAPSAVFALRGTVVGSLALALFDLGWLDASVARLRSLSPASLGAFAAPFGTLSACAAVLFFAAGFAACALHGRSRSALLEARATEARRLREEKRAWLSERRMLERYAANAHASYVELEARALAEAAAEERDAWDVDVRPSDAGDATTFQAILEGLGDARAIRAAVLSDDLGLPIATFGRHAEALAACSALLARTATTTADHLPLGRVRRVLVEDDRLATITACRVAGSGIFVATLTAGPAPDAPRMADVLERARALATATEREEEPATKRAASTYPRF